MIKELRKEDMSFDDFLAISKSEDTYQLTIFIGEESNKDSISVEFCTSSGGGYSPNTRDTIANFFKAHSNDSDILDLHLPQDPDNTSMSVFLDGDGDACILLVSDKIDSHQDKVIDGDTFESRSYSITLTSDKLPAHWLAFFDALLAAMNKDNKVSNHNVKNAENLKKNAM
jgi:hypothetical protein